MNDVELKNKVVQGCKILYIEGIRDTFEGHLSARQPGSNKIFIPGHIHVFGRSLGSTTIDDIITVDLDTNKSLDNQNNLYNSCPNCLGDIGPNPRIIFSAPTI